MTDESRPSPPTPATASTGGSERLTIYNDTDIDWIARHDLPIVLSFPYKGQSGESKSRAVALELLSNDKVAARYSFGEVIAEESQKLVEECGVSFVPSIVVLYKGKPMFIMSGDDIVLHQLTENCQRLLSLLDSPESSQEVIMQLEKQALEYAAKLSKRLSAGEWQMVPLSGIVPGVVMAVARQHMDGITWLLPTGLAYAICITNGNFRFGWLQKLVATGIMYAIGMHWREILELLRP